MNTNLWGNEVRRSEIFQLVLATVRNDSITKAISRMFSGTVIAYNTEKEAYNAFWEFVGLTNQLKKDDKMVYATLSIINITTREVVGNVVL